MNLEEVETYLLKKAGVMKWVTFEPYNAGWVDEWLRMRFAELRLMEASARRMH